MIICQFCNKKFKAITNTHLKAIHNITLSKYKKRFPNQKIGFPTPPNLLPENSQEFIRWKNSLKKRGSPWNKGHTKETHPGVLKTSQTMKKRKIDNFKQWREEMRHLGKIKSQYPSLPKNEEVAELIGLVLGDGNLYKHKRTERLTISFNTKYPKIIKRGQYLVEKIFQKKPIGTQNKIGSCARIWIYEKHISKRLGIPCGAKKKYKLRIPEWVWKSEELLKACLVGLYNAEGSYSVHKPTYTYNLQFSNTNKSLLKNVHQALKMLKYSPNLRKNAVRLRRKKEAKRFLKEIKFQEYRS